MPASEGGVIAQTLNYAAAGCAAGAFAGLAIAGYNKLPVGETSMSYVSRTTATHTATLGSVAAAFAITDALLEQQRPHAASNSVIAGCAAGAMFGARQGSISKAAAACVGFAAVQAGGAVPTHSPPARPGPPLLLGRWPPARTRTRRAPPLTGCLPSPHDRSLPHANSTFAPTPAGVFGGPSSAGH